MASRQNRRPGDLVTMPLRTARTALRPSTSTARTTTTTVRASMTTVRTSVTSSARANTPMLTAVESAPRESTRSRPVPMGRRSQPEAVTASSMASTRGAKVVKARPAGARISSRVSSPLEPRVTRRSSSNRSPPAVSNPTALVPPSPKLPVGVVVEEERRISYPGPMANVYLCPICYVESSKQSDRCLMATACGHVFCNICLLETFVKRQICPMCQTPIKVEDFRNIFL